MRLRPCCVALRPGICPVPVLALAIAIMGLSPQVTSALQVDRQQQACLTGSPQDAIKACTALLERAGLSVPDRVATLLGRGNAFDTADDLARALADYDAALELAPGSAMVHRNKGTAFFRRARLADAFAEFDAAVRLQPTYALAYASRAQVVLQQSTTASAEERTTLLQRALADLDKAIELGVEPIALGFYTRASVLRDLGRLDAAVSDLTRILATADDADARADRARILSVVKRCEEAKADVAGLAGRPWQGDAAEAMRKLRAFVEERCP